jgi:hypothetical protein
LHAIFSAKEDEDVDIDAVSEKFAASAKAASAKAAAFAAAAAVAAAAAAGTDEEGSSEKKSEVTGTPVAATTTTATAATPGSQDSSSSSSSLRRASRALLDGASPGADEAIAALRTMLKLPTDAVAGAGAGAAAALGRTLTTLLGPDRVLEVLLLPGDGAEVRVVRDFNSSACRG